MSVCVLIRNETLLLLLVLLKFKAPSAVEHSINLRIPKEQKLSKPDFFTLFECLIRKREHRSAAHLLLEISLHSAILRTMRSLTNQLRTEKATATGPGRLAVPT